MAYLLFIDESGHDLGASPYEVLAGVCVEDRDIWNLVLALQEAERRLFGMRYADGERELKAKKLLNRKTFRLAAQMPPFAAEEMAQLAREALENGESASRRALTAFCPQ